jgi:DNA polymerase
MLMADFPSPEECAEGRPLAGDSWILAQRMLAAIGIAADDAYLATLACFHAPGARLDDGEIERCGAIARDHIRHAKPQRLLLFGDAPARALTGHPLASARGKIHRIEGARAVATFHPRWLLQRPSDKALAWQDLLLLMSEEGP